MELKEKELSREYFFKGKIINARVDIALLPNGKTASREVVEHPGGVCVLPLDSNGDVLLVEQYRYPYSEVILEIPAGKRDRGTAEEPLECGIRELKEEIGATAENYRFLGQLYPSPGFCNEVIFMYLATGLAFGDTNPDEDEFLNIKRIPLDTVVEMVMSGEIKDAKTQAAVLKTKYLLDRDEF